jgi:hypothetical protein
MFIRLIMYFYLELFKEKQAAAEKEMLNLLRRRLC